MPKNDTLAAAFGPELLAVVAALAGVTGLAWFYLFAGPATGAMAPAPAGGWEASTPLLTVVMWIAMMIGMMAPSAVPMVLVFATVELRRVGEAPQRAAWPRVTAFVLGYVAAWSAFSVLATVIQGELQRTALISPMLTNTSPQFAAALFIAAGLYQFTAVKRACLHRCRSPLEFLAMHWRRGRAGAFRMGLMHGLYCLGCCWLLMMLLFAVGVMNLVWVAALTVFVLAEKIVPGGALLSRLTGLGCLCAGVGLLL